MTLPPLPRHIVEDAVRRALAEDLGGAGDITSLATLPGDAEGQFELRARRDGVLCGLEPALEAFRQCGPGLTLEAHLRDGARLEKGATVLSVSGRVQPILTAERTALNFLGRMSGIATMTAQYVKAVEGSGARIVHTRKTTPGLRAFEIQAVRAGGGGAHRFNLADAILIKDNHVAAAGGVGKAVRAARAHAGHMVRISTEIDRLDQLDEAIEAGADVVLLDNFSLEDMRAAVSRAKGKLILEASGGVDLTTVRTIAETGVDIISVGALTHSAPNFDLGLDAA
ncbi:MAG: nicotinate-nucleotide diphosphorylase (carboxylating) [Maricaulis sp.]|jgi:nicotinate-nucleotide pyrophosphorylase (carboxylating)|nr:nicotinate-nucleotide diphosphorylase (carboxylating) [Maricaulis sp.]HAQ35119.1 carboxylating nicotinate-nucleotide diphosphorylase [Alphaproteobacteria bacterium]